MKVLLVSPEYPATFWSFRYALPFVGKKASIPPLGLLTVSAMLPRTWERRLVDMNASRLDDADICWADCVFVGAMIVQKAAAQEVLDRARRLGKYTVAGGPLFTTGYNDFRNVDTFVLGEAENLIADLAADIESGHPRGFYSSPERPDLAGTPVPDWDLLEMKNYASMAMQISRGCPFDCEFCDIVALNGRVPRVKETGQVIRELDSLYKSGWRGSLFIVDDNFIGNRAKVKEILRAVTSWMHKKGRPFTLYTEASINLADDAELMRLMQEANFNSVFIGIETPSEESLLSCGKVQNTGRNLAEKVRILQRNGLQVQAGFILGFDSDTPGIFDEMVKFIQKSGIVTAMIGLLNALPETRLYKRLQEAGRLLGKQTEGNNTDFSVNFMPKMDMETLINGYRKVLDRVFSARGFYDRVIVFLKEYRPTARETKLNALIKTKAFLMAVWRLGVLDGGRAHFWRVMFWTLFRKPRLLAEAVTLSIYGFHFRKVLTAGTGMI